MKKVFVKTLLSGSGQGYRKKQGIIRFNWETITTLRTQRPREEIELPESSECQKGLALCRNAATATAG
jgi:hypothetical protein